MSFRFLLALATALVATVPAIAQNPKDRKSDPTVELLAKLRKPVDLTAAQMTLADFAEQLGKTYNLTVLIDETAFKRYTSNGNPGEILLKVPPVRGMSLLNVLPRILGAIEATYLVFKDHLEIVPIEYAAQVSHNLAREEDEAPQLVQPLVSMVFKEKPLNEAVAELADDYNLTVVVLPQSGDARTGFVSARFLNTPADKALELLALQCDLRIVRKANTFTITTRDHANDLFNEQMERERAIVDLAKFKAAPYMPPLPPAPQPPVVQPPAAPNPPPPVKP